MKCYLVTGIAGFIGSAIAKRLINDGNRVVGIDNFMTGFAHNVPAEAEFFEFDISDYASFQKLSSFKFDAVLHLAAQSSGEISYDNPAYDVLSNTMGTLNALRFAELNGCKRFLYASSMSIYGDVNDEPISVDMCPKPKSYYGITKLSGEHYLRAFASKIDTTSFRMFNVYGPGQNMQNLKQGMVSIYLAYLMNNEPITVKGDKNRFRDFIYIDDVVDAWVSAIDCQKAYGKIYNLSCGKKTTVEELLNALKVAWGKEDHIVEFIGGTPGDQFGIWGDISAIQKDLKWTPKVSLYDGIAKFIEWVKCDNA